MNNGIVGAGGAKFSPAFDLPIQDASVFAVGDMNGDGLADVIFGRKFQTNQVYINRHGAGDAETETGVEEVNDVGDYRIVDLPDVAGTAPSETKSITVVDVDGDGDLDIIERDTRRNRVLINDGTGMNYETQYLPDPLGGNSFVTGYSDNIAVADMDGDGKCEIIFCDLGPNKNVLLKRQEYGKFDVVELPGKTRSRSLAVGDVNGDGHLDIMSGLKPVLLLNSGDGLSYDVIELPVLDDIDSKIDEEVNDLALEDLNGDGILDFIYCGMGGPKVLINRGDGSVDLYTIPSFGEYGFTSMALGDIDGDGILDLAVAHSLTNHSHLLLLSGGDELDNEPWYASLSNKYFEDDIVLALVVLLVSVLVGMCCKRYKKRKAARECDASVGGNDSDSDSDSISGKKSHGALQILGKKLKQKLGLSEAKETEMVRLNSAIKIV